MPFASQCLLHLLKRPRAYDSGARWRPRLVHGSKQGPRPGPQGRGGLRPTAPFILHSTNCPDRPNASHRSLPILSAHMQQKAIVGTGLCTHYDYRA
eukprot:4508815-Pleurochrysis_carterae.AAC.1